MGATRVIAVNASRFIPPPGVGMMIRGVRMLRRRPLAAGADVVTITPDQALGRMADGAIWRQDSIRRWIAMGENDAAAALAAMRT